MREGDIAVNDTGPTEGGARGRDGGRGGCEREDRRRKGKGNSEMREGGEKWREGGREGGRGGVGLTIALLLHYGLEFQYAHVQLYLGF